MPLSSFSIGHLLRGMQPTVDHVNLEGLVFLVSSIPTGSYAPSTTSSTSFPSPGERGLVELSCLGVSVPRSLTLHSAYL